MTELRLKFPLRAHATRLCVKGCGRPRPHIAKCPCHLLFFCPHQKEAAATAAAIGITHAGISHTPCNYPHARDDCRYASVHVVSVSCETMLRSQKSNSNSGSGITVTAQDDPVRPECDAARRQSARFGSGLCSSKPAPATVPSWLNWIVRRCTGIAQTIACATPAQKICLVFALHKPAALPNSTATGLCATNGRTHLGLVRNFRILRCPHYEERDGFERSEIRCSVKKVDTDPERHVQSADLARSDRHAVRSRHTRPGEKSTSEESNPISLCNSASPARAEHDHVFGTASCRIRSGRRCADAILIV